MVKLLSCYHRILGGLILILLCSCSDQATVYKRVYTESELTELKESLNNAAGTDFYYQGSVGERMLIHEALKFDDKNANVYRELGVPYLKRGIGSKSYPMYKKASDLDPESWAGYMAYCWLYFYRDYETTLERIEQLDTLTPNFVDYPQATSIDYMRGVCYLQLEDLYKAIFYLQKHLDKEIADVGPDYIDALPYQLLGIAYTEDGQHARADSIFNLGLTYNKGSADLFYYKSLNHMAANENEQAKESLDNARKWFAIGGTNTRPYVEEFYAIYQEDLDLLAERF